MREFWRNRCNCAKIFIGTKIRMSRRIRRICAKKLFEKLKKPQFFCAQGPLAWTYAAISRNFFLDLKNLRIFFNQHLSMQRFHSNDACGGLTKKVIFTSVLRNFAHATSQLWIYIAYFSASQRGVGVAEWVKRRRRR